MCKTLKELLALNGGLSPRSRAPLHAVAHGVPKNSIRTERPKVKNWGGNSSNNQDYILHTKMGKTRREEKRKRSI